MAQFTDIQIGMSGEAAKNAINNNFAEVETRFANLPTPTAGYIPGIYNVNHHNAGTGILTLTAARELVPMELRRGGFIVRYLTGSNSWATKEFYRSGYTLAQWNADANWRDFIPAIPSSVTVALYSAQVAALAIIFGRFKTAVTFTSEVFDKDVNAASIIIFQPTNSASAGYEYLVSPSTIENSYTLYSTAPPLTNISGTLTLIQ